VEGVDEVRWRVPVRIAIGKLVVAAVLVVLAAVAATGPWQVGLAALAVAGVVAWALRDLLVPVRLAADGGGVTLVAGIGRRVRLSWSQVDRVRVDTRRRSKLLEVDTGETLHLFSRYDLDADLEEVARRLEAMRNAAR
jgi:hypothetical protein